MSCDIEYLAGTGKEGPGSLFYSVRCWWKLCRINDMTSFFEKVPHFCHCFDYPLLYFLDKGISVLSHVTKDVVKVVYYVLVGGFGIGVTTF